MLEVPTILLGREITFVSMALVSASAHGLNQRHRLATPRATVVLGSDAQSGSAGECLLSILGQQQLG